MYHRCQTMRVAQVNSHLLRHCSAKCFHHHCPHLVLAAGKLETIPSSIYIAYQHCILCSRSEAAQYQHFGAAQAEAISDTLLLAIFVITCMILVCCRQSHPTDLPALKQPTSASAGCCVVQVLMLPPACCS